MVRKGAVRRGLARFVSERRLWWGSLGRHRELHGGCGPALSGLAGRGLAVLVRSGVVWSIPVRLDMAVLIRHEQVRQGGVR